MHAITEGSAARIGDSRVRSTQMAEEDKWIVGSRNSASGLLVRPNLLLIIARGSSLGLINCPTSSTFMQLNVQGGALHSGGPSAAALLDPLRAGPGCATQMFGHPNCRLTNLKKIAIKNLNYHLPILIFFRN